MKTFMIYDTTTGSVPSITQLSEQARLAINSKLGVIDNEFVAMMIKAWGTNDGKKELKKLKNSLVPITTLVEALAFDFDDDISVADRAEKNAKAKTKMGKDKKDKEEAKEKLNIVFDARGKKIKELKEAKPKDNPAIHPSFSTIDDLLVSKLAEAMSDKTRTDAFEAIATDDDKLSALATALNLTVADDVDEQQRQLMNDAISTELAA